MANAGVIGIDPGLDGALAYIGADGHIAFHDIPTLEVKSGVSKRREYDVTECWRLVQYYASSELVAAVEKIGPMPSQRKFKGQEDKPAASSLTNFSLGQGLMIWKALLAAQGTPYDLVPAQTWKKEMRIQAGSGKDAARLRALQLFPAQSEHLSRKKDQGRADALLIAEWRRRQLI